MTQTEISDFVRDFSMATSNDQDLLKRLSAAFAAIAAMDSLDEVDIFCNEMQRQMFMWTPDFDAACEIFDHQISQLARSSNGTA